MTEEQKGRALRLDDDQIRILTDLESVTKKSVDSMIREGLEMYIKVTRGQAIYHPTPETMLSPIVFDRPYRTFPPK
jgi:hypothetical protein